MPIAALIDVTKVFRQGEIAVKALRGLSLSIEAGDFMAVSWPSGSGKTTALNLLGALDVPTTGQVLLEGRDLASSSPAELAAIRRDRVGFVFQAYNLIPVMTAMENAEAVLALQGVPKAERRAKVGQLLDTLGLQGMHHRRPDELSGGQQQRVAIARAIAADPALVLADEPTANLDSETSERLLELMGALNRDLGTTFVFSTHDPRVMAHARRNVVLVDGRVARDERREDGATPG